MQLMVTTLNSLSSFWAVNFFCMSFCTWLVRALRVCLDLASRSRELFSLCRKALVKVCIIMSYCSGKKAFTWVLVMFCKSLIMIFIA